MRKIKSNHTARLASNFHKSYLLAVRGVPLGIWTTMQNGDGKVLRCLTRLVLCNCPKLTIPVSHYITFYKRSQWNNVYASKRNSTPITQCQITEIKKRLESCYGSRFREDHPSTHPSTREKLNLVSN